MKQATLLPFALFLSTACAGQWVEIFDPVATSFHNTAVAWDGKVYFTGGPMSQSVTQTDYNKKVEVLDLENGEIAEAPAHSSPARGIIGGLAHDGKIYFAGGQKWLATAPGLQLFDQMDIFDVASQTWEYKKMPKAKTAFGSAVVGGKLMFAGGYVISGGQITVTDEVNIYDPATGNWSLAHLSKPRAELAAGAIGDRVWFCGGQGSWTTWSASSRVDVYDASKNTWEEAELSVARSYPAVATAGEFLVCAGGYTDTEGSSAVVDMFDTLENKWATGNLSLPRFGMAAATVGSKAYFTGGGHLDLSAAYYDKSTNRVDVFDAETKKWSIGSSLFRNRMTHSCAAWGNKIAIGGGWRAEQAVTTGSIEILTVSGPSAVEVPREVALFDLFPNPASDLLQVSFSKNLPATATSLWVSDLSGKILLKKDLPKSARSEQVSLHLDGLPPGGYFLTVEAEGQVPSQDRFVVLR